MASLTSDSSARSLSWPSTTSTRSGQRAKSSLLVQQFVNVVQQARCDSGALDRMLVILHRRAGQLGILALLQVLEQVPYCL
jgi:hypothetical protein